MWGHPSGHNGRAGVDLQCTGSDSRVPATKQPATGRTRREELYQQSYGLYQQSFPPSRKETLVQYVIKCESIIYFKFSVACRIFSYAFMAISVIVSLKYILNWGMPS